MGKYIKSFEEHYEYEDFMNGGGGISQRNALYSRK